MKNDKRKTYGLIVPVVYFLIINIFGSIKSILPNFIMSLALMITLLYVFDWEQSIFTMSNVICSVGLLIGYFMRYLVCILNSERLTDFAPYPLNGDVLGHTKTALVFFVFVITYSFALNGPEKKPRVVSRDDSESYPRYFKFEESINSGKSILLFLICWGIYLTYNIRNTRVSTQIDYGVFDQLISGLFGNIAKILAYAYLYLFALKRKKIHLLYYSFYFVPTIYLSFIQAWKGAILIEILILCIVFQTGMKKIKKRYLLLIGISLFLVFPIISMMRDFYRYGTIFSYNLKSIIDYNISNSVFNYYIDRFEYYDGLYYVINVSPSIVADYKASAGLIISRFFSGMIPRAIWPEKPIVNVGRYVTYILLQYPTSIYNNLTIGFLADAYLDIKALGVLFCGLTFGLLVKRNEKRNQNQNIIIQSSYLVFGQTLFGFLEGDIAAKALGFIFVAVAYYICNTICYKRIIATHRV